MAGRAEILRSHIRKERPELNPYELETVCFNTCPFGHTLRPVFLVEILRMKFEDDPTVFNIEKDGVRNEWFFRQIRRLCRERFPQFMGCASSAKSYVCALYVYALWSTQPWCTSVFFSTTSKEAAEQRGWGYIKRFHRADKYKIGQLLEYKDSIVVEEGRQNEKADRDYANSLHLVLIKSGAEGDNAVAAISGRKNKIVIWLKDEAQLIENDCSMAEANLCANNDPESGGFVQIIDIGNAPRENTHFYRTCLPYGPGYEAGYKAIDTDYDDGWPTQSGYCEWFNGEKSPNVVAGRTLFRGLMTQDGLNEIEKRCGGRDTTGYWIQGHGFPPSADIRDTVLTQDLIAKNLGDQPAVWAGSGEPPKVLGGGDLGYTPDGDPCVAHFGKLGVCADGKTRLETEHNTVMIPAKPGSKLPFEDQMALGFIRECDARGCRQFQLDITGDGGIIFGRCVFYAAGRITFIPKSFGGAPDALPIGAGDDRKCSDVFDRMVTQLWYLFRMAVVAGIIRGVSLVSKSTTQLCSRKVFDQNSGKKISVETKRDMKKRIKRSPDDADATVNLHDLARKNGLATTAQLVNEEEKEEEEEEPEEARRPYTDGGYSRPAYGRSNRSYCSRY
jgi:hypothetical protein